MIDLENLNSKNIKLLEKISKNAQKKYFNLLDKLYINFLKEDKSEIFQKMIHFIYNLPFSKDFHALSFRAFKGTAISCLAKR